MMTEPLAPADFSAALTDEQVADFGAPDLFGLERRIMLAALGRSGPQLLEGFRDSPEVLVDVLEHVADLQKHLAALTELATSAEARLLIVGQLIEGADAVKH